MEKITDVTPSLLAGRAGVGLSDFSLLAYSMRDFERETEFKNMNSVTPPFSIKESTPEAIAERRKKIQDDYWEFDRIYYTENMYSDGYSKPCEFHKFLSELWKRKGVNVVFGPRKNGKTVTMKKVFVWLVLTGKITFGFTFSSTLPISRNILADIVELIGTPRILHDFKPEIIEANKDQLTFSVKQAIGNRQEAIGSGHLIRIVALSEGRSLRGASKMFERPQFGLFDDLETRQSPLSSEHTEERIKVIAETYQSMSDNGCMVILGNNFDRKCALNRLLIEQNEGTLPGYYKVFVFKAWQNNKPLWEARYPAKSENELKIMLKAKDHAEWCADFQQEPVPADGYIFQRLTPIPIWNEIPPDARGVLYCDPNLAKKSKGDTTAIVSLLYSVKTDLYYVADLICHSYSDSDKLLTDYLKLKDAKIRYCGFDGHVSQESTWTNNIRSWCKINGKPYPNIFYCRYKVDECSKNISAVWNSGRLLLPPSVTNTKDGQMFFDQLISFSGKKANNPDDGPDALICAFEMLHENHLGKRATNNVVKSITDFFNF